MEEEQQKLLHRLQLQDRSKNKLTSAEFLQIKSTLKHDQELQESDLCSVYFHKLLMLDYRAWSIQAKQETTNVCTQNEADDFYDDIEDISEQSSIHPLDVQMAAFHCSDSFLKQMMVTKLSQCQYAVPLLVPDPSSGDIECPLWTLRQIRKSWKKTETKGNKTVVTTMSMPICKAETPLVLCFRLGSLSVSKSQIMNSVVNGRHSTFFHRNCPGSTKTRLLLDGVAEIAWYCPAGKPDDSFSDCVAFCNLHGEGLRHDTQLDLLKNKASVNVVFVPTLDRKHESAKVITPLLESSKPLIVLIENSVSSATQLKSKNTVGQKYKVGLKDRNQSDVSKELKGIIRDVLSGPHESFQLDSLSDPGLRVDEQDTSCKKSLSSAEEIMRIIKSVSVSEVKNTFLPCQGQPWHNWSRVKKEMYHLKGNVQTENQKKLNECQKLREDQCKASHGKLMKTFVGRLSSLSQTEREYFLKWTQILLDEYATESLSLILGRYNQKWSEVLDLKKQCEDKRRSENVPDKSKELKSKQAELSQISQELQSATCGLEHIFREMAQIYEAHQSLKKPPGQGPPDWSKYPELAAELMISGHPMELMDGDAGHVPLTWIKSLINQVVLKLGDKKVFVLSVLGIQSSGKSTMLNAMFGLQFAVSAGRCTRGAFMQLLKLSEELKKEFQWDYLLVVDTEGLRALELDGNQTIKHDNELATFVVGLGNMTLVNIFGENPSEMQDVLQIVVQAFMRMKQVRLSPSCVFVHQNVTDVSASEKNMDGKIKLQEKLDKMAKIAAKEEVYDAQSFSDIIEFDVQNDVKYFAQLWEGSPPMAPPNPGYSQSVQDLKSFILQKAKTSSGVKLSEFRTKVEDLWKALLSENFVFSFKNTLEMAASRKLEVQYGKWTWELRSAMLKIEEKFNTQMETLDKVDSNLLYSEIADTSDKIKLSMSEFFESDEDKEILIQWRTDHEKKIESFLNKLVSELQEKLNNLIKQNKDVEEKKTVFKEKLLQKSQDLALELRNNSRDDQKLEDHFNNVWKSWVSELTREIKPAEINTKEDLIQAIKENGFEMSLILSRNKSLQYKDIAERRDYADYVAQKQPQSQGFLSRFRKNVEDKNQEPIKNFIKSVEKQASEKITQIAQRGYSSSVLRQMCGNVIDSIDQFESERKYRLVKDFKVDLILFVFDKTQRWISDYHSQFVRNNVATYLESKKDEYCSVFKSFCKGSSSTVLLAEVICKKLKASMTEVACNQTAIEVAGDMRCSVPAFKDNKLNLEKHILKSLAEKREFQRYIKYIKDPKSYTETFIKEEVNSLLHTEYKDKCMSFFNQKISRCQEQILRALHQASQATKEHSGDINKWLQKFTGSINTELTFGAIETIAKLNDVKDFDFIKKTIEKELQSICSHLSNLSVHQIKWTRQRPEQILIDQLCDCCWETCPFCRAVCTHTVKNHKIDVENGLGHSTPFHRSASLKGFSYRNSNELSLEFCTTEVAGDGSFYRPSLNTSIPFKKYHSAGPPHNTWIITPDTDPMSYWQWVVCTFQEEIEEHYGKKYTGDGKIPEDWKNIDFDEAIENLEERYY